MLYWIGGLVFVHRDTNLACFCMCVNVVYQLYGYMYYRSILFSSSFIFSSALPVY